jgi:hypothetical protein
MKLGGQAHGGFSVESGPGQQFEVAGIRLPVAMVVFEQSHLRDVHQLGTMLIYRGGRM